MAEVEAAAGMRMEQLRAEHQREVAQLQAQLRKEQQEKELLSKRLDQERRAGLLWISCDSKHGQESRADFHLCPCPQELRLFTSG